MEEEMNNEYMKAKVFFERKIPIHIVLKSGAFYNGLVTEITNDFFFIDDREDGKKIVFFVELAKPIEEFRERV